MINDLDETIKKLLVERGGLDPTEVEISFDLPKREWSAGLTKPTINLYLYDVRENLGLRESTWLTERSGNGVSKRKPPAKIDLSYFITAWTRNIEDEHRLLWYVLATLLRHPILPADLLQGDLSKQEVPVRTTSAQPDGILSNPADFWTALDNDLKPSVNYVVTLELDRDVLLTPPLVRERLIRVRDKALVQRGPTEDLVEAASELPSNPENLAGAVGEPPSQASNQKGQSTSARKRKGNP